MGAYSTTPWNPLVDRISTIVWLFRGNAYFPLAIIDSDHSLNGQVVTYAGEDFIETDWINQSPIRRHPFLSGNREDLRD